MLSTLPLYLKQNIELKNLAQTLLNYNYQSCDEVNQEGDFSLRGGIIDIFPVSFENPIRLELVANQINSIRSFDVVSAQTLDNHGMVIILPRYVFKEGRPRRTYIGFGSELPIANFVDIEVGDYVVHINHGIGRYLGIKKLKTDKVYHDQM